MTTPIMKFQDFRFIACDENVTIRRGTKWNVSRGEEVTISDATGDPRGDIRIIDTAALQSVYHVPIVDIFGTPYVKDHHAGWTFGRLCEFFREQYPLWMPSVEIVTLVRFEVLRIWAP